MLNKICIYWPILKQKACLNNRGGFTKESDILKGLFILILTWRQSKCASLEKMLFCNYPPPSTSCPHFTFCHFILQLCHLLKWETVAENREKNVYGCLMASTQKRSKWSETLLFTFMCTHIYALMTRINEPFCQSVWIITQDAANVATPDPQIVSLLMLTVTWPEPH